MATARLHATCVALRTKQNLWSGILFCGPSGSGKSDLALRCIHELGPERASLVADDYVDVCASGEAVEARSPLKIFGKIEVRGLGILELPALESVAVSVAFDLVDTADVPRFPEPRWLDISNKSGQAKLPLYTLSPFEASAVAKVIMTHETHIRRTLLNLQPE